MNRILKILFGLFLIGASITAGAQRYYLIVASHSSEAPALSVSERYKASGFVNAGYLFSPEINRYRVYLNRYSSLAEAREVRNNFRSKFPDSWILDQQNPPSIKQIKQKEPDSTQIAINNLDAGLAETMQYVDDLRFQITQLQDQLRNMSINNTERDLDRELVIDELKDTINILEEKIAALEEKLQKQIEEDYVKKTDTVDIAREAVTSGFKFVKPGFSLSLGAVQAFMLTNPGAATLAYFNITDPVPSEVFYGFSLSGEFYLSKYWKTGISVIAYPGSDKTFLFPYFNLGYSRQLGNAPLRINPFISVGTEAIWRNGEDIMAGRYIFYAPGLDIEWAFTTRTSLFMNYRHNLTTFFENDVYKYNETQHSALSFGLRFNFHK
ncbi:MAG: SPOR domain-containing protein [Prolixibacteraceae bacterium]|jgi:polyhydroxyalkanoate synthesis regulator phasin|nr:SPOR domain-containing protein [Prolixibacteraceae bacterium]